MKVVIASGKGGTGKTTVAVNLAYYLSNHCKEKVGLFDCDVEGPNVNLFVKADIGEEFEVTAPRPVWNEQNCTGCGKCKDVCKYNAIAKVKEKILIFNELCHSCGACSYLCPQKALDEVNIGIGKIQLSKTDKPFYFGQGILNIGESLAPMVVNGLKENCQDGLINIIDASPGTSCSVVKAMEGADIVVLVTEPTSFGLNDLKLAVSLTSKMKIPTVVVINRSGDNDQIIEKYCARVNVKISGKIPFGRQYAESYSRGDVLIEKFSELKNIFDGIYQDIINVKSISIPLMEKPEITKVLTSRPSFESSGKSINCKELVVISGKGGTGKTTITAALAELMKNMILSDSDVDAANLHLLMSPKIFEFDDFIGGKTYFIDQETCNSCGLCKDVCHFGAVKKNDTRYIIDEMSCEGCGFCMEVCPADSISNKDVISGEWYLSNTRNGLMSHAKLGIGEENSGKLVTKVRENASLLAEEYQCQQILSDGPPGTGCPVISSITGADLILIVTEPTVSGVHDMKRVMELAAHFKIKALIVVNKSDLNDAQTQKIKEIAKKFNSKVIGEVPFDENINNALIAGKTILDYANQSVSAIAIRDIYEKLKLELVID